MKRNKGKKRVAIVVPEYNEGKRAVETIEAALKVTENPIIVIDDGSNDGSFELLNDTFGKNLNVIVRRHVVNLGKGAAMKTGVHLAWKMKMDGVIFMDADGQHEPKHLLEFEKALETSDMVFGYRSMGSEMPAIRKWGNVFSVNLIKTLFKLKRQDLLCGYFGFNKDIYKLIEWKSPRYGVETEIATKVGRNNIKFSEVKIDTIYIDKYKGVTIFDAFRILFKLPLWYFER